MSMRPVAILLTVLLISRPTFAEEPPTIARLDVERLQAAGLNTDPARLLALVRPTDAAEAARIPGLVRDLESDEFAIRTRASQELVRLGRPARAALEKLPADAGLDVQRQVKLLLDEIDNRLASATTLAVLRTLCRQNHPEAAGLVVEHLPNFTATQGSDLLAILLRVDPTTPTAEAALSAAQGDALAERRAAAGLLLARKGSAAQVERALTLLKDDDATVRFRVAQGLIGRGDERGLAPLVALLGGPADRAWQAEELLRWVAGPSAPVELLGRADPKTRKACQTAWEKWLAVPDRAIDWLALRQSPRRPALYLTSRGQKAELMGSDGAVRFTHESAGGGSLTDAHLLPDGRMLTFDDNECEVRLHDNLGKILWKWRAPGGEIAMTLQPLPQEDRVLVVTDEQLHELSLAGKHLRTLRLGDKFFSDACLIDASRIIALTDEGFFVVDRASGSILREIHVPNRNELLDSGKLQPLPEGLVAVQSSTLENVLLVDPSGSVSADGPVTKNRQVWGLARFRTGNWIVGSGAFGMRIGEQTFDGRTVREILLGNRPARFRPVLEDLRLGLDDDEPAPFNVDSASYRIASLKSADLLVRRRAATVLGQYRDQAAVVIPALVDAFDVDDEATQTNAARSLSQLGTPALPALRQVLRQGKPPARIQAARGVGMLASASGPAVQDLIALISDRSIDAALRTACCDALGELGATADLAAPTLRETLADANLTLRRAAAVALGSVGRGEAVNVAALIARLDDREEAVVLASVVALSRWGTRSAEAVPSFVRLLERGKAGPLAVRTQIVTALADMVASATPAVPALTAIVREAGEDDSIRMISVRTLAEMGPAARDAVPVLRDVLLSPDKSGNLHPEILRALGLLRHVGGIAVLMDAARSGTENVRYTAVTTLGGLGVDGQVALPLLKELNTTEKSPRVRTAIQRALKRIPVSPVL